MAIPGTRGGQYTADGLTHTERGTPTSGAADHLAQLDKRRDKLDHFNYGDHWASVEGAGDLAVITWGSLTGAAREAAARAAADGSMSASSRHACWRLSSPKRLAAALDGVETHPGRRAIHGAQFHRYLRAHYDLPVPARVFHRPGPLPITAGEIHRAITDWR